MTIALPDWIGTVTMDVPVRYDTFFSWRHYSDCGDPCDYMKYRYQPSYLPLIKESGSYWPEPKDSVERFTIEHSAFRWQRDDSDSLRTSHGTVRLLDEARAGGGQILSDTILCINSRYFGLIKQDYFDYYDSAYKQILWAGSSVKGNWVKFKFERFSKNKLEDRSFVENAEYFLKTIHIR